MGVKVSDEHRRRRRAAYLRSAAAHERAAEVHTAAMRFFGAHGDEDRAERHRQRADVQMELAIEDWHQAESQ